jgi:hypothetical protein
VTGQAALTPILLERAFDPGIDASAVARMAAAAAPVLTDHAVTWQRSFLSLDGRHLLCCFAAPSVGSARTALQRAGATPRRLWAATEHLAAEPSPFPEGVAVERRFTRPVTVAEIQAREDAGAWCLDAHRVHFVRTFLSRDRRRMICLYHAPDAESVRAAQRQIGMPMSRLWACVAVAPADYPA